MDARETARALANFANGASKKDIEEFVDELVNRTHRTLQQRVVAVFMGPVVDAYVDAEKSGRTDLRNAAAAKLCKRIAGIFDKFERTLPVI